MGRTKAVNAPYVPSRVVRDGALMSDLLPSARVEGPLHRQTPTENHKGLQEDIREDMMMSRSKHDIQLNGRVWGRWLTSLTQLKAQNIRNVTECSSAGNGKLLMPLTLSQGVRTEQRVTDC